MSRSNQAVKGFYKEIDGNDIIIFVAKEPHGRIRAGDIVTSIVPTTQQKKNFGL